MIASAVRVLVNYCPVSILRGHCAVEEREVVGKRRIIIDETTLVWNKENKKKREKEEKYINKVTKKKKKKEINIRELDFPSIR